uniref:Uncharacterized protein n=1 Tax=Glossina brevipalpis TaxID=37001 RepID=A0A1A9W1G1_9MUSC
METKWRKGRSSNHPPRKMIRYNKIPTTTGKRRNRITSSSTLLKIDADNYVEDEEDEDEEEEDDVIGDLEEVHDYEIETEELQGKLTKSNMAYEEDHYDNQHDSDVEYYNRNVKKGPNIRKTKLKTLRPKESQELQTFIRVPNKKLVNTAMHQMENNTKISSETNRTT